MEIDLDIRQKAAVESDACSALVIAGPGAGKTRVICHRIFHLIEEGGIEPGRIIAVTFTNRASDEMRRRLLKRNPDFEAVRVSTFHSLALNIVKRHYERAGFAKRPIVFDETVQDRILGEILREKGMPIELFPLRRIKNVIDLGKANLSFPLATERFPAEFEPALREVLIEYQKAVARYDALDFSDILLAAVELLALPDVRESERALIDCFLIDEFQDMNFAQYALVLELNPPGMPVFTVADEDQTIYNWRGSSSRFMRLFLEDYNPDIYKLEKNWRCAAPIITAARGLISRNRYHTKYAQLEFEIDYDEEPLITLFHLNDEKEEFKLVMKLIANAVKTGRDLSNIAILARAHYMLDYLHQELVLNRVPVVRVSKESPEHTASDLLSYFELTRSMNEWDVENVMRFPSKCATSLDEIRMLEEARREGDNGLFRALKRSTRDPRLGPLTRKRIGELLDTIGGLPDAVADVGLSMAVHKVLEQIELRRSPLKIDARNSLREAVDGIAIDPSLNIDTLRDALLKAKGVKIIHNADPMSIIAAMIISETTREIFGADAELIPYSDDSCIDGGKHLIIASGLDTARLAGLFGEALFADVTCISPGSIHLPSSAMNDSANDYTLPLAAYALCFHLATPRLPDEPLEIVFLDLETTSVDTRRAEIVEIAALRFLLDNGVMRETTSFHSLVKPSRPIPPAATSVHHITNEMVADAPLIEDIIGRFVDFLGDSILAGHNIDGYDLPIIRRFAGRICRRDIYNPTFDTLALSRELIPRVSHTLGDLASMYGVPLKDAHRAMDDVRATAALGEKLLHAEALDAGLDFSQSAINLLTAGILLDDNAPEDLTSYIAEASGRSAHSHGAQITGFDSLAEALPGDVIPRLGDAAKFIAVWEAYNIAREVTKKRLYLEAMNEIMSKETSDMKSGLF